MYRVVVGVPQHRRRLVHGAVGCMGEGGGMEAIRCSSEHAVYLCTADLALDRHHDHGHDLDRRRRQALK